MEGRGTGAYIEVNGVHTIQEVGGHSGGGGGSVQIPGVNL